MTNKILWIDFGYFMFRAVYSWKNNRSTPPTYMCLNSIISNIKKVGLTPNDKVIIAVDSSEGNWRKDIDPNYKANRREQREKASIDWDSMFKSFNWLLEHIDANTPFHIVVVKRMEADDIIAYGCKKFKESENIILSADSDYEQLCSYDNVKIFSPSSKHYKKVISPHKVLFNKIKKETADNLIAPVLTLDDYRKREKIVNLMRLPREIEEAIDPHLESLHDKHWDYDGIYWSSLRDRLHNIYVQDKIVPIYKKGKKRVKKTKVLDL